MSSVVNNLWESSNESFNCLNTCGNDGAFFMPLERFDMVTFRLQIPYNYVTANGGGLPTGANVALSIVDEAGTTTLASFSTANNGRFNLGYKNDNTNKNAEYQFQVPTSFADPDTGVVYSHYYFDATTGDHIKIVGGDGYNTCDFIYGVDPLPATFYRIKPNRIVVPAGIATVNGTNTLEINGTPTTLTLIYTSATSTPTSEDYSCFRYKAVITFTTSLEVLTYYTKPFKIVRCEDTLKLSGSYPASVVDCLGYYYDGTMTLTVSDPSYLYIRIPADLDREANRIRKSYNSKCFNFKSEIQRRYRLKSDPVPYWFASEVENIAMAQDFGVDNVTYLLEDSEQVFQNNQVESSNFQYIDLPLSSCKCEKIFVC